MLCCAVLRDGSCESRCDIDLTSCLKIPCDLWGEKTTHPSSHTHTHAVENSFQLQQKALEKYKFKQWQTAPNKMKSSRISISKCNTSLNYRNISPKFSINCNNKRDAGRIFWIMWTFFRRGNLFMSSVFSLLSLGEKYRCDFSESIHE